MLQGIKRDNGVANGRPRANSNAETEFCRVSEAAVSLVTQGLERKLEALDQHLQEKVCRICFCGEDPSLEDEKDPQGVKANPLLAPCGCTGSSRYIHLSCLQSWLERSRMDYEQLESVTTIYRVSSCELCSTKYPDIINYGGQKYEIFKVDKPQDIPYLILEVLGMAEGKNFKIIGVPRDKVIVIGRHESCEIIVNDQSISQRHSKIFYSSLLNKFILQDLDSKYGTLKVIMTPLKIEPGRLEFVQVGLNLL